MKKNSSVIQSQNAFTGNNAEARDQSYVENQFWENKETVLVEY